MPGLGFIALLDDVSSMMDKVAAMAKANMGAASSVADKTGQALGKSAGVVGDDIALGADVLRVDEMEERIGLMAKRELKIVWEVAKGSAVNKVWISGLALGLSATAPWALHGLLAMGGAYLCMEGAEKVAAAAGWGHGLAGDSEPVDPKTHQPLVGKELARFEREKIKGAVRTDMVLSGEIILITLAALSSLSLVGQAFGLLAVGIAMTIGVYASVGALVKIDDVGLWMLKKGRVSGSAWMVRTGGRLMVCMPVVMRGLTFVGVCAMLGVGGGILCHSFAAGAEMLRHVGEMPMVGAIVETLAAAGVGLAAGLALEFFFGLGPVRVATGFLSVRAGKAARWVKRIVFGRRVVQAGAGRVVKTRKAPLPAETRAKDAADK